MGLFTEQFLQKLGLYKRAVRPRITGFTGFFLPLWLLFLTGLQDLQDFVLTVIVYNPDISIFYPILVS